MEFASSDVSAETSVARTPLGVRRADALRLIDEGFREVSTSGTIAACMKAGFEYSKVCVMGSLG